MLHLLRGDEDLLFFAQCGFVLKCTADFEDWGVRRVAMASLAAAAPRGLRGSPGGATGPRATLPPNGAARNPNGWDGRGFLGLAALEFFSQVVDGHRCKRHMGLAQVIPA